MKFSDYVYVDKYCDKKFDSLFDIISKNKKCVDPSFFAIILNEYSSNIEFEDYVFLQQKHYEKRPPIIVGLAKDYSSAQTLVSTMVADCLKKVGSIDYISFLASLPQKKQDSDKPILLKAGGNTND